MCITIIFEFNFPINSMSTFCFLDCLGSFELLLRKGYFKNGHVEQGVMSDHGQCACACNDNKDCVACGFRDDDKKCYFYIDVSDLNEKVTDPAANIYIKKSRGNNFLLLYIC